MTGSRPLVVCRPGGQPCDVLHENEKGYRKTLEQRHLWALHPGTGRLLPFYEAIPVAISDRGSWYEAVLARDPSSGSAPEDAAGDALTGAASGTEAGMGGREADATSGMALAAGSGESTGAGDLAAAIASLAAVIADRREKLPEGSYTTHLFSSGGEKIRKKLGEEAVEVLLARTRETILSEAADLVYHLFVLLESEEIGLDEVALELRRR